MTTRELSVQSSRTDLDVLELELRRVPGVEFVGFSGSASGCDGRLVVQVRPATGSDLATTKRQATDVCDRYSREPLTLQFDTDRRPARVQLLSVREVGDEGAGVEVHLAFGAARTVGRGEAGDAWGAAAATVEALEKLGAHLPYEVSAAAVFEHAGTEGVMLILRSRGRDHRFGVAHGDTILDAAARATLHALNRHLAMQHFC